MITANLLRAIAASWLRYEKQCPLVTFERGLEYNNNPDVLAIDKNRYLIEIEIKISMSDFRADAKKYKWVWREGGSSKGRPRLFYYMVPPDLKEKVEAELKPGFGLISINENHRSYSGLPSVDCIRKPIADKLAARISVNSYLRLVKQQSGTLCGLANYEANSIYSKVAKALPASDR